MNNSSYLAEIRSSLIILKELIGLRAEALAPTNQDLQDLEMSLKLFDLQERASCFINRIETISRGGE